MARVIPLDALTVDDLVNLGERAVTDQLPKSLLLTVTRLYVAQRVQQRQRQAALSAERRAYRSASGGDVDALEALINAAAMKAAQDVAFDWRPLLDVPFLVPTHDRISTWGLAPISDHADRASWLERMSAGNLRTAIEHRAAIDDIEKAGVSNLVQVVGAYS